MGRVLPLVSAIPLIPPPLRAPRAAEPATMLQREENFLKKPDYGKRPAYLDDVAKEREMEQKIIAEMQREHAEVRDARVRIRWKG